MSVEVINGMADTIAELEEQLESYKEWVDLEDSEIIAECVHRYGGKAVVDACRVAITENATTTDEFYNNLP